MRKILALSLILSGCSGAQPFVGIGVGYQFTEPDFLVQTNGQWKPYSLACTTFHGSAGIQFPKGWEFKYLHRSCIDPSRLSEIPTDEVVLEKRLYGW